MMNFPALTIKNIENFLNHVRYILFGGDGEKEIQILTILNPLVAKRRYNIKGLALSYILLSIFPGPHTDTKDLRLLVGEPISCILNYFLSSILPM